MSDVEDNTYGPLNKGGKADFLLLTLTMEMSDAWPGTYDERYIHQFKTGPTHKSSLAAVELTFKISSYGTSLK